MYYLNADVNAFEKIIAFLGKTAEKPQMYGAFHIISLCVIFVLSVVIIYFRKRLTDKFIAYSFLVSGIIMAVFEIYKQLVISYIPETDTWIYSWSIFPFQFCSTPIYLTLIAFFAYRANKTRLFKSITAFLGTYSLIGAIVVLFIGTYTVLNPIIGINIQTMLHHGIMFLISVTVLVSGTVRFDVKTVFGAFKLFCVLTVMALILIKIFESKEKFDMFYLSKNSDFIYPAFKELFGGRLPHYIYVMGYIALFTVGAFIIVGVGRFLTERKKDAEDSL